MEAENKTCMAIRNQLVVTLVANLIVISYGICVGWISPSLLILRSENSSLINGSITTEEASWIGSILCFGAILGSVFFGFLASYIGTKNAVLGCTIPVTLGWIIVKYAQYPWQIYCSRCISGLTGGGLIINLPLFIAEISDDHCRGALSSLLTIFFEIGILMGYIFGTYLDYDISPIVSLVFPFVSFCCFLVFPSSPQFLLRVGKINEAEKSLKFYRNYKRGDRTDVFQLEFDKFKSIAKYNNEGKPIQFSDFLTTDVRRAIIIGPILMAVSQFTGTFTLVNYAASIFKASGSDFDPNISSFFLGSLQIVGTIFTLFLIDKVGRKYLLLASTTGSAVGSFVMGTYSYLSAYGYDVSSFNFVPVVSLSFVIFISSIGIIPIPYIIAAELFPQKIRRIGAGISLSSVSLFGFIMLKTFPILQEQIGLYGCMWMFSIVAVFGLVFTSIMVRETKGKNLDTLENK